MAWEESIYPKAWVNEMNENIHGVMAASNFTKEILKRNGVTLPIKVIWNAIDEDLRKEAIGTYPLNTNKTIKFFHNSTGKTRKGIDILLKAYTSEFNINDNVVLIIKGFPNPDNKIDILIKQYQTSTSPEILYINNPDLTDVEIRNLTAQCSCGVFPSRAEGFGLPILECMYQNIPVITTNYSGQLDFCNEDNSYLIEYKLEFAKDSEFVNIGAKWAEPNVEDLMNKMRIVYKGLILKDSSEAKELQIKVIKAKKIADLISWENSAKKALQFIKKIEEVALLKENNLGVITWLNNENGIAEYSYDLYNNIESSFKKFFYISNKDISDRVRKDKKNVYRTWVNDESTFDETINLIKEEEINIIHIQYHSGSMFSPQALSILLSRLKEKGIKIFITLHSVRSTSFDFIKEVNNLKLADKVIVLNSSDADYAKQKLNNVIFNTLGNLIFKKRNKEELRKKLNLISYSPIICTHGLLNTNKGILQIVEAINQLKKIYPDILLLSLNAVSSNNIHSQGLLDEINNYITKNRLENNIVMITEFLSDQYIQVLMQTANINVFAYKDVGESASAAVRKGLDSLNPTIITDIKQFQDFNKEVYKIKNNEPENIVKAIVDLLNNNNLSDDITNNASRYIEENSYDNKSLDLLLLYKSNLDMP